MIVYLDIYFFINSLMNFLILSLLSTIFHYGGTIRKRLYASLVGGFGATFYLVFLSEKGTLYKNMFLIFVSAILLFVAYEKRSWRTFLKQWICFYIVTYNLGGILYWFLQQTKGGYYMTLIWKYSVLRQSYLKKFIIISLFCSLFLSFIFWIGKEVREERRFLYPVSLQIQGKRIHTIGLLDTGNRLREPRTGKMVIVGEWDMIERGLEDKTKQWLLSYFQDPMAQKRGEIPPTIAFVPFSSVGNKNGELPAILCDEIFVAKKGEIRKKDVWIGLTKQSLSPTSEYFLLLHTDLWKEC